MSAPPPYKPMPILCVSCRHYKFYQPLFLHGQPPDPPAHVCQRQVMQDVVTGMLLGGRDCYKERADNFDGCGESGKFFEGAAA